MELNRPFNLQIWESLSNGKYYKLPPLKQLTQEQSDELSYYIDMFKNYMDSIGLKTYSNHVTKTVAGYTISRHCTFYKECNNTLLLQVFKNDRIGKISFMTECKNHR